MTQLNPIIYDSEAFAEGIQLLREVAAWKTHTGESRLLFASDATKAVEIVRKALTLLNHPLLPNA